MKPAVYGSIVGFFSPIILMALDYLPAKDGDESNSIIASALVGLSIGLLLKLSEILYAKLKQN